MVSLTKAQYVLISSSGFFLGIVLYFYEGFGIDQGVSFSGHTLVERVLLFMVGVSATFAINEAVILPRVDTSTLLKKSLWILWEIFSAASVTFILFDYFWSFTETSFYSYFLLLGEMTSVLIVPFILYFLVGTKTKSIDDKMVFTSTNEKEAITISPNKLLYLKSDDNYIKIIFLSGNEIRSALLRKKLSDAEKEFPQLIRVHRSYLVNPLTILKVDMKSKAKKVYFEANESVPVSNSFIVNLEDKFIHHT